MRQPVAKLPSWSKVWMEFVGNLTQIFLCRRGDQLGREQNVLRAEAGGSGEERKEDLPGEVLLLPPPLLLPLENPRELKTLPSLYVTSTKRNQNNQPTKRCDMNDPSK